MKKTKDARPPLQDKSLHSKAFTEGINNLFDEIQLAFQWHRPSILLAIHNTTGGQQIAQQFLEKKLSRARYPVQRISPQKNNTDVIHQICSLTPPPKTVFYISGLENANQLSGGEVYRALNIHREHLVEKKICAVFWLTELEAASLPRFAPDFWAFRHRVVEFAPQRGSRNPFVPSGMFLWKEPLPWMNLDAHKKQIAQLEDLLSQLPVGEDTQTARLDATLKLIHHNWQLQNLEQFHRHFESMLELLKTYLNFHYQGWTISVKGIKLFQEGDRSAARTCFEQALQIEPNNSRFLINAAILAHGTGKNREAIVTATRAVKNDPTSADSWHVLGLLHLFMGNPQQAVEAVQKALENQPDDLDIQYCLAICQAKNNQPEACEAQLVKIAKGNTSPTILQSACHSILSGNLEGALLGLHQSLKSGIMNQHQLLQDPNLHALVDAPTLLNLSGS